MMNWMMTGNYLIVHYGESRPCVLEKGTNKFNEIFELLNKGASDDEVIKELDICSKIEEYSQGTFKVDKELEIVIIDGQNIHGSIAERIVEFCREDLPYLPLVNFWRKIQLNPSEESKSHLFLFLEVNKMPITHDGCFLAYKKVKKDRNGNFVDCHTETFCNNVGAVVTMPREKVNPDRQQACSAGLHVAAYNYAAHEYDGQAILEVKVNPKDVVAVPYDYNNQKMRVCRYEVVMINPGKPVEEIYLPEEIVEEKKKSGKKVQKKQKALAKKEEIENTVQKLCADSVSCKDVCKDELFALPAQAIIRVVQHHTGNTIMIALKNKKSICKKAASLLEMC